MIKTTIYFATRSYQEIDRIRWEYELRGFLNVNGECECEIDEATLLRLQKEVEAGLIQIRKKGS